MNERLVFGIAVYRESEATLNDALASIRHCYPDQSIFVVSDGTEGLNYQRICSDHKARYILSTRLKVIQQGGAWWQRHLSEAETFEYDYFIKIDPDTRLHRPFRFYPEFDVFGTREPANIQGGIQGVRRKAVQKILSSKIMRSTKLSTPSYWATCPSQIEYTRTTGQISTDAILMFAIRKLHLTWGDWAEVDSLWRITRPFRPCVAATHPHK